MISERVEEAVGIRRHARTAQNDRVTERRTGRKRGQLGECGSINIIVGIRHVLKQMSAFAFNDDRGSLTGERKWRLQADRHRRSYRDILRKRRKSGNRYWDVSRVRRDA